MLYIEINKWTRLGNWMFEYAAAISIADKVAFYGAFKDWRMALPSHCDLFSQAVLAESCPESCKVYKEPHYHYAPIPSYLTGGNEDFILKGFFQSYKYFDERKVRNAFAIPASIGDKLRTKYGNLLSTSGIVGVHVRRGDYLAIPDCHPFVGKKYLRKAVNCFPKGTRFIICSDDIEWCKHFFVGTNFFFSEGNSPLEDIYLLSLCNHNIMSNSSFSWWGAWLNEHKDKRVIAPSLWFGFGLRQCNTKDLLWDKVEVIENHYTPILYLKAWKHFLVKRFKIKAYPLYKRLFKNSK